MSKVLGEASNKNLAYELLQGYELQDACELAEVLAAEARDQVGLPPTEDLESSDFEIVANEGDPLELDEKALQKIDDKFKRKKSVYQVTFKGKKMDCFSDADVQKFLSSVARQIAKLKPMNDKEPPHVTGTKKHSKLNFAFN